MEYIAAVAFVVVITLGIPALVALVGYGIYVVLNPPTYIERFTISATHVCASSNCGVIVNFKIANIYPDTMVSLSVFADGIPPTFIVEDASIDEFNEFFTGVDLRLFKDPGIYTLELRLSGNLGSRQAYRRGQRRILLRRRITLLSAEDPSILPIQHAESGLSNAPYSERFEYTRSTTVSANVDPKIVGPISIYCKYTELISITLVNCFENPVPENEVSQAYQLNSYHENNADLEPFLSPLDDPDYEDHPCEVDVEILFSDGTSQQLGTLSVGGENSNVVDLPEPLVLNQTFTIRSTRRSGSVPFFPGRVIGWQLYLLVQCR